MMLGTAESLKDMNWPIESHLLVQVRGLLWFSCTQPHSIRVKRRPQHGFTLLELIIATIILLVLTSMAVPLARLTIKREKERELRNGARERADVLITCFALGPKLQTFSR
jgi:prepilin-type N-terminal cleavage/methylation domain-containing protein